MTWRIPSVERRVFLRNTLDAVICQLRFNPILKIEPKIADFQELVRSHFPSFNVNPIKNIIFNKGDSIDIDEEKQFLFQNDSTKESIYLTTDAIAFETKKYVERSDFLRKVKLGIDSLTSIHGTLNPKRLGIRFVNSIKKEPLEESLKRTLIWSDLIKDGFLQIPENLYDLSDSFFLNEVTSASEIGKLTLKYGLLPSNLSSFFRFDVDRYIESAFDITQYEPYLEIFTNDTFALFSQILKPSLIEWMDTNAK